VHPRDTLRVSPPILPWVPIETGPWSALDFNLNRPRIIFIGSKPYGQGRSHVALGGLKSKVHTWFIQKSFS